MTTERINIQRLFKSLISALIIPMFVVAVVDYNLASLPLLTVIASLVLIPLSTIVVVRTILAELDRVLEIVSPADVDNGEA